MNLEKDPDPNTTPAVLDTAWRHGWNEAPTGYNSILCREVLISLRIRHAFPCFTHTAHPEGRSRTSHTSTRSAQPYNARHPWRSIGVCRTLLHAHMESYSPDVIRGGDDLSGAFLSKEVHARRLRPEEKHVIGKLRPTPHRWREPAGARPLPAREIKKIHCVPVLKYRISCLIVGLLCCSSLLASSTSCSGITNQHCRGQWG